MEYFLLHGKEADAVRNYMPKEVLAGFTDNDSRYALCATEDNKLIGVGVFDAFAAAHILSIRTIEEYRGEADREILSNILTICENLNCEGVHFEIYDEDDRDFWEMILYETGFFQVEEHELFSIPFIDLEFNVNLDRVRMTNHVIPLEQALPTAINSYGNKLVNSEAYDKFITGEFDGQMSALYVNDDDEIEACFLISNQGKNEGFTIEYANAEGCKDKTALFQMIKYSCEVILSYYTSDSLSGYALAMNPDVGKMIKKGFPHAKVADRCAVFAKVLSNEDDDEK